jgi:hypothetical protein
MFCCAQVKLSLLPENSVRLTEMIIDSFLPMLEREGPKAFPSALAASIILIEFSFVVQACHDEETLTNVLQAIGSFTCTFCLLSQSLLVAAAAAAAW